MPGFCNFHHCEGLERRFSHRGDLYKAPRYAHLSQGSEETWWMIDECVLVFLTCLFLPSHRCLISLKLGGKGLVAAVQSRQLMFMVPFVLGFSLLLYQEWGHTRCFGKRKGQLVTAHSRAPCTALPPAVYSSIRKRDSSDLRRCWTPSLSFWCFQTFISAVYLSTRQDHLISNPR